MAINKIQLVDDLSKLEIPKGALVHLKVSIKSMGFIRGGPDTLIDAILEVLGPEGTIVVNAFVQSYLLPLSSAVAQEISTTHSLSYAGAFVNAVIRRPDVVRSRHPVQRFAAIGPRAFEMVGWHDKNCGGYDVLGKMTDQGAYSLAIGEGISPSATVHVAIERSGLKKKNRPMGLNFLDDDNKVRLFEVNWNGGCSRGFKKFVSLYEQAGIIEYAWVGGARSALTEMEKTLKLESEIIRINPDYFFCADSTCKDCRLRWEHSSGIWLEVKVRSVVKILIDKFCKILKC